MLGKIVTKIQMLPQKRRIIIFLSLFVLSFAWILFRNPVYIETTAYIFPIESIGNGRVYWGIRNGYNKHLAEQIPEDAYYRRIITCAFSTIIIENKEDNFVVQKINPRNGIHFYQVNGNIVRIEGVEEVLELPIEKSIQLLTIQNGHILELYFSSIQVLFQRQLLNRDVAATFPFYLAYTTSGNMAFDKSTPNTNLFNVSHERRQWFAESYLDPVLPHFVAENFRRDIDFPFGGSLLMALMSVFAALALTGFLYFVPYLLLKTFAATETNKLLFIGLGIYLSVMWLIFRHSLYCHHNGALGFVIRLEYSTFAGHFFMISEYIFYLIGYSSRVFLKLLLLCAIIWNFNKILSKHLLSQFAKSIKYGFLVVPLLAPFVIIVTVSGSRESDWVLWILLAYSYFILFRDDENKTTYIKSVICLLIGIAISFTAVIFALPYLYDCWTKKRITKRLFFTGILGFGFILLAFIAFGTLNTDTLRSLTTTGQVDYMGIHNKFSMPTLTAFPFAAKELTDYSNQFADLPHKHNLFKFVSEYFINFNNNIIQRIPISILAFLLLSVVFVKKLKIFSLINGTFIIHYLFAILLVPWSMAEYTNGIHFYAYFMPGLFICSILKTGFFNKRLLCPANIALLLAFFTVNFVINPAFGILKHINAVLLFSFAFINISFLKKKLFIICVRWKSTAGNHTGQAYDVKFVARKFENFSQIIYIPHLTGFRMQTFFYRCLYKTIKLYLSYVASKNDILYLTEYFHHGSVFDQVYFSRHLHGRLKIIAVAHLVPQWVEDSYSNDKIIEYASYVDKLLVLGNGLRNYYISKGVPDGKVVFVHHPVDNGYYAISEIRKNNDKPIYAVVIGNMLRGHDDMRQIISMTPNIKYHVFSGRENSLPEDFKKMPNVISHGKTKEKDLRNILHNSDVSLNVMQDTVGSNVIVTSMASGMAMVCSDVGSIRDYVPPNSGMLFNSVHEAVNALNRLDGDRELLYHLQKKSLTKAKEIDIKKVVDLLYSDIINIS